MAAIKTLLVKFDADTSAGKKGIADLNSEVDKSRGMFGGAKDAFFGFLSAQAVIGGVKEAWGFLSGQIEDTIQAGMDQQKVLSETTNTLQHMGSASGQTSASVGAFADQMAQLTGVSDDVIQHGENVMLTFGNIGKTIFPQATTAALNMSTMLGQDLQSSVIMVGKALNDPLQGLTALQRVGVSFSDQEKQNIKTMMAHGETAKAQGIIMGELNKQFGGAAVAAGTTFDGQLKRLNVTMDQAREKIGLAVIPILNKLLTAAMPLITAFADALPGAMSKLTGFLNANVMPTVAKLSAWITSDGVPDLQKLGNFVMTHVVPALAQLGQWAERNVLPVLKTLGQIILTDVVPALENIWSHVQTQLIPALMRLWDKIEPLLIPALKFVGGILKNVVGPAIGFVVDVAGFLINVFTGAIDISEKIAGIFIYVYEQLWNKLKPGFEHVAGVLKQTFKPQLDAIGGAFNWLKGLIGDLLGKLGNLKDAVGSTFSGLGSEAHKLGIPGFAEGTDSAPGGLAWVGEHGRELMYVPRGAQILPHDESTRLSHAAATAASSSLAAGTGLATAAPVPARITFVISGREVAEATISDVTQLLGQQLRAYGVGV